MLRHIVLFRWKADASVTALDAFGTKCQSLPNLIGGVERYVAGPQDEGVKGSSSFDFAICIDFADADAFGRYQAHPAHVKFVDEVVRPIVEDRATLQFHVPG